MPLLHIDRLATLEKALKINLSRTIYGTFAEIGAGQEIANWFFRAGSASGTIAKTMSAYDMTISDEIYGKATRYVSRQRMCAMLEHEYPMLLSRLNAKRGSTTSFFTLADTVRARARADTTQECHGWIGLRFQTEPTGTSHDIQMHVRLLDDSSVEYEYAINESDTVIVRFYDDIGELYKADVDEVLEHHNLTPVIVAQYKSLGDPDPLERETLLPVIMETVSDES